MNNVFEKLKIILRLSGFTQEELARELAVSFAALNRWINQNVIPRSEKLQKIDNESSSRSLPKYIFDFIFQIEFEIENSKGKTKKELILTKYENYDYFVEKIEKKLHDSAKRYLGMNIDDDSDNDD